MSYAPTLVFRPAQAEDYPEIQRITAASYLNAGHFESADHPYMQRIADVAARAALAEIWVAEADSSMLAGEAGEASPGALSPTSQLVGAVTLARFGEPYADIAYEDELEMRILVVDPAIQRRGIGRGMVNSIIDHTKGLEGVKAVSLTTGDAWTAAHALYQSLGFVRQPQRDWRVDLPTGDGPWLRVYRFELSSD